MKIGYACICLDLRMKFQTCTMKYASEETLQRIIAHNLKVLMDILHENVAHDIRMYRLSSDLIPFGSSPINTLSWQTLFQKQFQEIGAYIRKEQLRVSLHPGQFCVLNSPREDVVERTIADLSYHAALLDLMELDTTHKMVLHVGGVYEDKKMAMDRFCQNFKRCPLAVRRRLILENDDRYYGIQDVLVLSRRLDLPVVFDNLHHALLPLEEQRPLKELLPVIAATWKPCDGLMKVHFCEQDVRKRPGAHAMHISCEAFLVFLREKQHLDMDIMLEVKDKQISAIKCKNVLAGYIRDPLEEWQRYRFLFLMQDRELYRYWQQQLCPSNPTMQNDKPLKPISALAFYQSVEPLQEQSFTLDGWKQVLQLTIEEGNWNEKDLRFLQRLDEGVCMEEKTLRQGIESLLRLCERREQYTLYNGLWMLAVSEV